MIVFVHGMGMSAGVWDDVVRALPSSSSRSRSRPVALDLPGHGARAHEAPLEDIVAMADDVARHVVEERFVVVGHSMGGAVVQALVAHHKDRIERAVLVSTALRFPAAPVMLEAARADIAAFRALFKNGLGAADVVPRSRALVDACSDDALVADIAACAAFDARPWDAIAQRDIARVAGRTDVTPMIVVGGALDEITPPKAWRRVAEMWGAPLVEAGPHGHMLPETWANEIARVCAA